MGAGWGELRVGPCGALTRTVPGLAGEVGCVRGQALPYMEQQDWAGGFSQKEKDPQGNFGEFSCSSSSSLLSTKQPGTPAGVWGSSSPNQSPNPKHRGECPHWRDLRPQASGRVHMAEGPARTHSPEEGECLNLWVQGLLESWAAWVLVGIEKSWARPPELAAAKKTSKTGLASLKSAGFFKIVLLFFEVILYYHF